MIGPRAYLSKPASVPSNMRPSCRVQMMGLSEEVPPPARGRASSITCAAVCAPPTSQSGWGSARECKPKLLGYATRVSTTPFSTPFSTHFSALTLSKTQTSRQLWSRGRFMAMTIYSAALLVCGFEVSIGQPRFDAFADLWAHQYCPLCVHDEPRATAGAAEWAAVCLHADVHHRRGRLWQVRPASQQQKNSSRALFSTESWAQAVAVVPSLQASHAAHVPWDSQKILLIPQGFGAGDMHKDTVPRSCDCTADFTQM